MGKIGRNRGRRQISQVTSIGELYTRFRLLIHEGAKFLVIGAVGAIITFGVANALHPIGKYKAITVATILATVITYLGNRYWTFRHRQGKGTTRDSIMFFVLNGVGLVIYYACIGLIDLAGLGHSVAWYNVALVVGTGLGTLFRFWSYRRWIWLASPAAPATVEELRPHMASASAAHDGSTGGSSADGASSANSGPHSHAKPGRPTLRHTPEDQHQSADGRAPVSHRRPS
jgi:putative flippase GtrA